MSPPQALTTYRTAILPEWVDYNGHLRDAFYLLIFSYATDELMAYLGMDSAGRDASGHSLFTLECHLNYLHEVQQGAAVEVRSQVLGHDAKRLHLHHGLYRPGESEPLAASEQLLLNVALAGPRAAPFAAAVLERLLPLAEQHRRLPSPPHVGRVIALPVKSGASA